MHSFIVRSYLAIERILRRDLVLITTVTKRQDVWLCF